MDVFNSKLVVVCFSGVMLNGVLKSDVLDVKFIGDVFKLLGGMS